MDRGYLKTAEEAIEKGLALLVPSNDKGEMKAVVNPFDQVPACRAGNIILEYDMGEDVLYRYYHTREIEGRKYKRLRIRKFREEDKGIFFIQQEDWKLFKRNFCEGACESMDLRIREIRGQEYRWYHAVFSAICSNGKLEKVGCFLESIDRLFHVRGVNGLLKEVCKEVVSQRFETVSLIDAETGNYRSVHFSKDEWGGIPEKGSYDKSMEDYVVPVLPDEDSRQTVSCLHKKQLLELLDRESVVKRYFRISSGGESRWKLTEFNWFREDKKQIVQVISDVNEEKVIREHLKCIIQDKENDDKAGKAFLSGISREIQSVMNSVIETSDMLLTGEISRQTAEKLKTIHNAGVSLNRIAGDILDFTDITSEGFKILPSDYCMSSLLIDTVNLAKIHLKNRDVKFFLDMDASVPEFLYGDDVRISQILMIILHNAIEFTSQGYITLKVGGHRLEDNQYFLEISITDTGIGMKDEEIAMITQPPNAKFLKGCHSRTKGLGIHISRNLARLMSGDLSIKSEYGQGSTFHITLLQKVLKEEPVMQPVKNRVNLLVMEKESLIEEHIVWTLEQLELKYTVCRSLKDLEEKEEYTHVLLRSDILLSERRELEARFGREKLILLTEQEQDCDISLMKYRQIPVSFLCLHLPKLLNSNAVKKRFLSRPLVTDKKLGLHTGRILLVDDSPFNLEMTRSLLESYLFCVDMADSGGKALKLIQENDYDLILMDQMMPGMNGKETLSNIKKLGERYRNIPVIALTAAANIGICKELLCAGFQDYLVKPLGVLEFNRILDTYIKPKDMGNEKKDGEEKPSLDYPSLVLMGRLRAACRSMDYDSAEEIVIEMLCFIYPQEIMEHLNSMLESCKEFQYDEFDRLTDELLNGY